DLQPGVEEFLSARRNRRPATDPGARRYSRAFYAALDCETFAERDSPAASERSFCRRLGALRGGNVDADRVLPGRLGGAGTDSAAVALPGGAHRCGREFTYRQMDLRAGGEVFHGRGWARSRSGGRGSSRRRDAADAKDLVYHRQMADHEFAGQIS